MATSVTEAFRQSNSNPRFLSPRYWPTWFGLMSMWVAAHLPFALQIKLGQLLGLLSYYFARERRHICEVNLRLCFPELSNNELKTLQKKTFMSSGIGLIEIAIGWYRNPEDYRHRVTVSGLDNLEQAKARGKGVLLVGAHFATLELGGVLFTLFHELDITYRPNKNPLFQAAMLKGRVRHFGHVFDRADVRGVMRSLKAGNIIWYAPDQDYGSKHSVFVPFFGTQAATITATSRFARVNDSAVLIYSHYRNVDNSGYHLDFGPMLENYPTENEEADAERINGLIEAAIRKQPDQYLWLHRRFKTQAAGNAARPY